MDPGPLPLELQGLTDIEEMLIARACPIMCVYRKHGVQRGYRGNVLNLSQDVQGFLDRLPRNIAHLPYLIIRSHGTDNIHRDCTLRREIVLQAIMWLQANNPFYADVAIDNESMHRSACQRMRYLMIFQQWTIRRQMKSKMPNKKMQNIRFHTRVIHFFHFHSDNRLNRMQYAH